MWELGGVKCSVAGASLGRFQNMKLFLLPFLWGLACAATRPNIIVIVADDLGWNDVSFHGSPQIPTPNLDKLAKTGVILNNYYVCPICSPSRGALMTGLYPIHTGLQHDVIYSGQPWGLPLKHETLPLFLRSLGYATHAVGKWHLGFFRKEYTPTYRGFDSHYGYWGGKEDYFDHTQQLGQLWGLDFHHNLSSVTDAFMKYSTTLFTDHAMNIVNQHNSSKPLFLYLAFQAVHSANAYSPLQAPQEYVSQFSHIKDKNRRIFAGMVTAMDEGVGKLVDLLHRRSMLKNSIIVFTTDNGGPAAGFNDNAASNWPLRGVKATLWEGGVRGAAFVWTPLLLNNSRVSMDMMHITDWLPTLYHAAGGSLKNLGLIDGYDMWHTLSYGSPGARKEVLLNIDPVQKSSALRVGRYKIIQGKQYDGQWDGWYGPSGRENSTKAPTSKINAKMSAWKSPAEITCGPKPENASTNCRPSVRPCVFDVELDPCEYNNIADSRPSVLSMLKERLANYASTAVPPGNKPRDPSSSPKYHNYQWINWMDYI